MNVKYDNFKRFEVPEIYVCPPGCSLVDGVLTNVNGMLFNASDMELRMEWNTTSTLSLRVNRIRVDDAAENARFDTLYRQLKNRRLLYLEGVGFFVITEVKEGYASGLSYKDITASSCEAEIQDKNVPYIEDGTYKFHTTDSDTDDGIARGLLNRLMDQLPLWTLGDIDEDVACKYRTFEDVSADSNILSFMLEEMQDAYECVFSFDTVNRIITVDDQDNYMSGDRVTDIHITKDDLIDELNIEESSEDLYTALSVYGVDDLSISAVNPLGGSVIYNFGYYTDWMSSALGTKVTQWQNAVAQEQTAYYTLNQTYYSDRTSYSTMLADREMIETRLEMYEKCRQNIVAQADEVDIEKYNQVLTDAGIGAGDLIPESTGYLWVVFADDSSGTNISLDPYGKNYIGLAYDQSSKTESLTETTKYKWSTFRDTNGILRIDNATFTWVMFADSSISGISYNPDGKACIGVSLGNDSKTKSTAYGDYTWSYINRGNVGVPQVLARIVSMIGDTETELSEKNTQIANMETTLETDYAAISAIHSQYSIEGYFTEAEILELQNYIFEGTYTDEYISVTDSMTQSERLAKMKELYDMGASQLEKASQPTQEFSVGVENFIFVEEFEKWSEELETGCVINVELEEDDVAQLFLTGITVNYEDKDLQLTFGNRLKRSDTKSLFNDVLGNIKKSANTLSYIRDTVTVLKDGTFNSMQEALNTSRTLTMGQALSAANETVIIDESGYTGAKMNPTTQTLDPHQIKINGRNIVFTDDAWDTCKTAIGEILMGADTSVYGINAELVMGELIMGNKLQILDSSGNNIFEACEEYVRAHIGDDLKYMKSTEVAYAVSSDGANPPSTGWSASITQPSAAQYLWMRTRSEYSDGTLSDFIYSVSGKGASITSVVTEYCLTDSSSTKPGASAVWGTTVQMGETGKYIWERSRIYWNDNTNTVTEPVLSGALNACSTSIEMNSNGITQVNQYCERIDGQVSKINAYIQTGALSYDESGKVTYGVKIGENLPSVNAYIRSGQTALTAQWLSLTDGGDALTPDVNVIYTVKTAGSYFNKSYRWNGNSAYAEASSDGTLSSVFTSSELGFYDTGEKTAYFSNKNLNVKTVRTNKVLLSSDVISDTASHNWQIGIDNGFYLKWVGASSASE